MGTHARRCVECTAYPTHRGRCEPHFRAYQSRPGTRARDRRREALRQGQDAAAQLRKKLRADIRHGVFAVCAMCGGEFLPSQVDIDHITPLYQGGEDVPENLQILCRSICHAAKTHMDAGIAPF